MDALQGVWAASLTPLTSDFTPDPDRLHRHIQWLHEQGCHGVVLFGTTGEATSFSVSERRALLDALLQRGVDPSRLIVGTGCSALTDTVELSTHAVDAGVRAVLMLPPFYYKSVSDEGLYAYFSTLFQRIGRDQTQAFLYHFPKMTGIGFSPSLVQKLKAAFPSIVAGVKDSSGDTDNLTLFCRDLEDVAVFTGSEALLSYALKEGGVGCISATANVTSRLIRSFYDGEKALADKMIRTRKALEAMSFAPTLKHILADVSGDDGWRTVRPPLMRLTTAHESRLAQILDSTGTLPNFREEEAAAGERLAG